MGDLEPIPADEDVGVASMQDIDENKCKEWARKDIEKTKQMHKDGWKFLREKRACTIKN